VNKAASVSVYTGRHFCGARERKNGIVGKIAEPQNKEADLLDPYTTVVGCKNMISGYSRAILKAELQNSPSMHSGE
jgi:hypothetical protein